MHEGAFNSANSVTAAAGTGSGDAQRVTRPLRVGVILDSLQQPAWLCTLIERLRASTDARLVLAIRTAASTTAETPSLAARARALYARLDGKRFGGARDALALRDVAPLLAETRQIDIRDADETWRDRGAEVELDVALDFRSSTGASLRGPIAHFGVWRVELGGVDDGHGVSGYWEFATERPATPALLRRIDGPQAGTILSRTTARTDYVSLRRGMNRLCRKSIAMVERELARLLVDDATSAARGAQTSIPDQPPPAKRAPFLTTLARSAARHLAQHFRDRMMDEQWVAAFRFRDTPDDTNDDYRRFHPLLPPRDRIWADPFVVQENGRTWLFVEEMLFREARGYIAVMELHRDGTASPARSVLERPYHLSYPCIVFWNGHYYMLPETRDNDTIELYRAVEFPYVWEPAGVLFADVAAVDSTLFEHDGHWWLYTTTAPDNEVFDELSLYVADSPLGPWSAHPANPLLSDVVGGRCGGRPFRRDGRLLRAAQIGARRYGHSLQLREIVMLTPDRWEERAVGTILPNWRRDLVGTHTLNAEGDVAVIDGVRRLFTFGKRRRSRAVR